MYGVTVLKLLNLLTIAAGARILVVVPTPSLSHQVIFRPITQELAKRGHKVIVITTDPAFFKEHEAPNITEIDIHDLAYGKARQDFIRQSGSKDNLYVQLSAAYNMMKEVTLDLLKSDVVQKIRKDNDTFDLVILEAWMRPALVFTHFFKGPTILVSSFGGDHAGFQSFGTPTHPILYPTFYNRKFSFTTIWERMKELYNLYRIHTLYDYLEDVENQLIRENFGSDVPLLRELRKNAQMLFLNVYPMWDSNRPVPPNVVYMGGIHRSVEKELPKDLETYLNSSVNGVIYVSFGSNISPSQIPSNQIQSMKDTFSKLPYDVLWKWDANEMPGRPTNIKLSKWLPQSDLLRHPKVKLFVTQAGLQSTDEAILAGVPLLAVPLLGDQWFNAEMYVRHGLGVSLDIDTMTSVSFEDAVLTVINDDSYRCNILKFRSQIHDQPQKPLERVVWWMEYVIRHGGSSHLQASTNITWTEYLQLDIVAILLVATATAIAAVGTIFYYFLTCIFRFSIEKVKTN